MREKTLKEPMPEEPNPEGKKAPKGFAPAVPLEDSEKLRQPFLDLQRLNQIKKDQADQLKQTNEALKEKGKECVDLLESHGLQNARLQGIGLVFVATKNHLNVTADRRDALLQELRARGFGDLIKTEPSVDDGDLKALVEELLEGGDKPLENVAVYTEKVIRVRK